MLLSRFWYIVLSGALAVALFFLYLATSVSNRTANRTAARLLTAASKAVGWYLQDDARNRAAALIPLSLDPAIKSGLTAASASAGGPLDDKAKSDARKAREAATNALNTFRESTKKDGVPQFDALWVVDVHGRVLASANFGSGTGSADFEMGGYSVVADALHGWIRDDAWVFDGRIYRVVARPVETVVGQAPVGALVGAKIVDDRFAQAISEGTGSAVAFYADDTRVATGAPGSFNRSALEVHSADLKEVMKDPDYQEKGRTGARSLRETPGFDVTVIFARMKGEAWDLGAGYVVGHMQPTVTDPWEFQDLADDSDKKSVPLIYIVLIAAAGALIGLILSVFEHTLPLRGFHRSVEELADKKSKTDVLKPSTFRGRFKKIAANINDALDKIAAQEGVDRGPADLQSVLGPLPAQPQMSAFAVPDAPTSDAAASSGGRQRSLPKAPKSLPKAAGADDAADSSPTESGEAASGDAGSSQAETGKAAEPPKRKGPPRRPKPAAPAADSGEPMSEDEEWRAVYKEFVALKKELGEPTAKLTYEKFHGTLQRNKDALVARHNCARVKFKVYEKQGRAALKASPVK